MSKFTLICFSIRLKRIYQEVEPKMGAILFSTIHNNKIDKVINAVYPYANRSYQEGIDYGNFITKKSKQYELTGRDKKKLFENFITTLKTSYQIFKLKTDRLTDKGTPKYDQFFKEYVTTVSKATNRLIIDSGQSGMRKAVR